MNAPGPKPYRHRELLSFIRAQVEAHGIPPTFLEMQHHLGFKSKAGVARLLGLLEDQGSIRRLPRRANGIELLQTKDYHLSDCRCRACLQARYVAQLKLVRGLKVDPPFAGTGVVMIGIRLLSQETRAALLGESVNAAPRTRTALPPRAS